MREVLPSENYEDFIAPLIVEDYTLVEIGHGTTPICFQNPEFFRGKRAYIGIETWFRNLHDNRRLYLHNKIRETRQEQDNIFFISIDAGTVRFEDGQGLHDPDFEYYEGMESYLTSEYLPETRLPNEVADEVVLSNVLTDPHIANKTKATTKLLAEVSRLLVIDGILTLRHTITPANVIPEKLIEIAAEHGLMHIDTINRDNRNWTEVEQIYNGSDTDAVELGSTYEFFRKSSITAAPAMSSLRPLAKAAIRS